MEKILNFIKSHYFLIFLLAIVNLLIAFFLVGNALKMNSDGYSYLNAMKLVQGEEYNQEIYDLETDIILKARILTTPLMIYSSIFFSKIVGSEYGGGMLTVNIIFYFLIIYVFYKLVHLIYQNHLVASLATILFFTNYCMINYGITYRTDIGGWFFFLLTSWWAVKYFRNPEDNKFYYLAILAASIGVLFKEYGALGLISLGMLIMFLPISFGSKVKKILKAGILFSVIPVLYHVFIYWQFHFSYFDWFELAKQVAFGNSVKPGMEWSVILLIKVLGWLFLVGWPIFLWGLYQEYKNFDKTRIKILLALLPASLAFLAWPGLTQRIAFILVPWLAMISAYGLSKIKQRYLIGLILIIYLLVGYLTRPYLLNLINF